MTGLWGWPETLSSFGVLWIVADCMKLQLQKKWGSAPVRYLSGYQAKTDPDLRPGHGVSLLETNQKVKTQKLTKPKKSHGYKDHEPRLHIINQKPNFVRSCS